MRDVLEEKVDTKIKIFSFLEELHQNHIPINTETIKLKLIFYY